MKAIRQMLAVSSINLRNLPRRATASAVIVCSTTGVVAVLISVLAMAVGFAHTLAGTGRADRAIILSDGAPAEALSSIPREAVTRIATAPGIRRTASGDPIADAELLLQFRVRRKADDKLVSVALRGVGGRIAAVRPELRLIEGRMVRPGLREIIIGRTAKALYRNLDLGSRVPFAGDEWRVVGIFASSGASSLDSGVLGDAATLMAASHHDWFNSVTALLEGPGALARLKRALAADTSLHVQVQRESEYFAAQARGLNTLLEFTGYFVGGMMAVGAIFCALNTMYAAIGARTREIATLRAMGFGGGAVVVSVLVEALALALAGAVLGSLLAWLLFDGHVTSISDGTQIAYALEVTPALMGVGILWAFAIGGIGGLFPAVRAAHMPVAQVLAASAR